MYFKKYQKLNKKSIHCPETVFEICKTKINIIEPTTNKP